MAMIDKNYQPADIEARMSVIWEDSRAFRAGRPERRDARPFTIVIPPPNVTGSLHMGHALNNTLQDILCRFERMRGRDVLWQPGTDHAGIATQMVVERQLMERQQPSRREMGREKFLERVWQWKTDSGGVIVNQLKRLGASCDWSRERFTMDEGLSRAVVKVFVELHRQGLIYKDKRLVNWDPKLLTAISDLEVQQVEIKGSLWYLRYPLEGRTFDPSDPATFIVVATTRPETMLGDTAVAVHPEDERYHGLIGKTMVLPILGRHIPVIADAAVEREFGTGAVKVTPAHDPLDYEIGLRHNLPMPSVIDFDGKMTQEAGPYQGMDRFAARDAVVEQLDRDGALVRVEDYVIKVPLSSRSGEVVEPLLSLQWFCKMESLAKPALEAYRDGRIRFVPERFGRTYEQWLENIRDWNVSRQIWWGHQLPVWYTPADQVVVAENEDEAKRIARETYGSEELRRDPDTLDTWFSSGLWPFSILGWPENTAEMQHWYPNQVMITSREIIFLWVARMVMLGMHFAGNIPFHTVFVTPLVFDIHGRKMSKSLGNVIDPIDLIGNYGADGTRFGILRQMRLESQELRLDERYCDEARRFANKLWNALRYVHSLPEGLGAAGVLPPIGELSLADRWVLTRLHQTVAGVQEALDTFHFGVAADRLIQFGWYEFCDWYLESTKLGGTTRASVLSFALNTLARIMHPIAPFVTEEIWQALPHDGYTIVTASWPDPSEIPSYTDAAARYDTLRTTVDRLRNARHDFGLADRQKLNIFVPAPLSRLPDVLDLLALHAGAEILADGAVEGQ